MRTKVIQFVPVSLALLAIGLRYISNWCIDSVSSCYGSLVHQQYQYFTSPLYFFALFFLSLSVILVFVPRSIFSSWLKFAAWAIPLAILYIWTTPVNSNAWMDLFPFYRDDAARSAATLFSIVSLILILPRWILTSVYTRRNQLLAPEGLEAYLTSWFVLLASIGGFACTLSFLVLMFVAEPFAWLGTILVLIVGAFAFNSYVAWHLYASTKDRDADFADRLLGQAGFFGYAGLMGVVISFALSLFGGSYYYPTILIGAALVCIVVGSLSFLVRAIRIFLAGRVPYASLKLMITSLLLALSMASLVLAWFLP